MPVDAAVSELLSGARACGVIQKYQRILGFVLLSAETGSYKILISFYLGGYISAGA